MPRPAPTRLGFVSLQVRNLEESKRFYSEIMGFKLGESPNDEAYVFETGAGAVFAIRTRLTDSRGHLRSAQGSASGSRWRTPIPPMRVSARGKVTIVKPIADGPFGRMFAVADPDGYVITVHGPKPA